MNANPVGTVKGAGRILLLNDGIIIIQKRSSYNIE